MHRERGKIFRQVDQHDDTYFLDTAILLHLGNFGINSINQTWLVPLVALQMSSEIEDMSANLLIGLVLTKAGGGITQGTSSKYD